MSTYRENRILKYNMLQWKLVFPALAKLKMFFTENVGKYTFPLAGN